MTASSPWLPDALWAGAFFDGHWQAAEQRQPVIEPATGNTLGEIGLADPAQVARSAAAAAQAQQAWASAPYEQRAEVLRNAARLAEEHIDTLVEWLVRESGSTRLKAGFEAKVTIKALHEAAALPSRSTGEILPSEPGWLNRRDAGRWAWSASSRPSTSRCTWPCARWRRPSRWAMQWCSSRTRARRCAAAR